MRLKAPVSGDEGTNRMTLRWCPQVEVIILENPRFPGLSVRAPRISRCPQRD